jgi:thiol:disulfide interchange protein DsbA
VQIHGVRKNLSEADDIAQWIDGKGTTADAFSRMFSSAVVSNRLRQADRLQRRFKVRSVPTLAVNGKYLIESNRNVGPSRMLEVLDYLIEKELAEKEQQSIKKKQQKMTDTQTGGA